MKELFKEISENASLVGASSLVFKDGKIVEKLNYGFSSLEKHKKVNNNTVFRIASVSKIMVALCIMKLYEEGKLDLTKDISEYLGFKVRNPKYPDVVITLKMIMTQTSSITDGFEKDVNSDVDSGYNLINGTNEECTLRDLLDPDGKRFVKETFSNYRPATHFEYSNFGCGILACIVEKITGEYFTDYVKKIVFKPLKIDASFVVTDIKTKNIASTYLYRDGENKLCRSREMFINNVYKKFPLGENFRGPAGGLFISTNGLMKIMKALLSGGKPILKTATLDKMMQMAWAGKRQPNDSYVAKGLQLEIVDYFNNRRLYGHFGDAYGVKSYFLFNREEQIGMVYITNGGNYKYQECGYCDIHEQLIKATLDKYWHKSFSTIFTFNINEKVGYIDKRQIELDFRSSKNGVFFNKLSLLDGLGISALEDYDFCNKEGKSMPLEEVVEKFKDKYNMDIVKGEESYIISYKHE
ncbi:MAG: serine hydrolase domain-containing protein [Bacilli bacterium]|nr:serine hydrolase domain-containing protein [Bacilli bacterium]